MNHLKSMVRALERFAVTAAKRVAPMTTNPSFRRLLPWAAAVLLSLAAAFGAIKTASIALERNFRSDLDTEVKRRTLEIAAVTMSSNVMGSVAALGIISQTAKGVLRGVTPLDHPAIVESLQAIGESYHANGVYLVNSNGIIQSCWYTIGVTLTGVDVKFRPYFQIAMQGKQNVYAAIGTTTGQRALYFAAPVYDEASTRAPIIGAAVARLDVERFESLLKSWTSGPALLLSPQDVTYASNRGDLNEHLGAEKTPEQLKTIRALNQFGKVFDSGTPRILPFDIGRKTVSFENQRYAVTRAPVQWNDPGGEWTLVLLGDLDDVMPPGRRAAIGGTSGALALVLSGVFIGWRRRLQRVNAERLRAELELKASSGRLKVEAETKSYLVELSADLQQAATLGEFARKFLFRVAQRLELDYGLLYALDEHTQRLTPVGGHSVLARDAESLAMGQGLVGQCAKDMAPIVISDAAQTDIRIVWGQGAVAPKSVILLPVVQAGSVLGVIVLAALRVIDADKRALLDAIVPMAAMNLEILMRNLGTQLQAETLQRQQTQLQETETWYRGIIESAPDGMLVVDEHGVIILTNPHIDSMFGYGSGVLVGQKVEVLVPPEVRPRHPGLRESFMQSGEARAMGILVRDLRGVRKDGTEFPVEVGLSRLPALGGRGICACASVRDITERKRAEQAMAEERERLQLILDTSPVNVAFSTKGNIHFANPLFVETFGVKVGDASPQLYVNTEERDALVERLKRGDIIKNHEIQMYDRHKQVREMLISYLPINYGGEDGILGWLMDITERKQGEERLRGLLEGSPAAVTIVTEEGEQLFCNRRLADMLGAPLEAVKLRRSTEFWANHEDRVAFIEQFKREGRLDDYEARFRRDDGRIIWVLLNTRWMEQDGQRLLISWMYDITDRKQAEVELKERMEELERFSRLTVDREEKMIQLKEEINSMLEQSGKEKKYKVVV